MKPIQQFLPFPFPPLLHLSLPPPTSPPFPFPPFLPPLIQMPLLFPPRIPTPFSPTEGPEIYKLKPRMLRAVENHKNQINQYVIENI
jgi:hypothetical protein